VVGLIAALPLVVRTSSETAVGDGVTDCWIRRETSSAEP
jgi:hypothetical protein